MVVKITSGSIQGIDVETVEIETDIQPRQESPETAATAPRFSIIGLPDAAVRESRFGYHRCPVDHQLARFLKHDSDIEAAVGITGSGIDGSGEELLGQFAHLGAVVEPRLAHGIHRRF